MIRNSLIALACSFAVLACASREIAPVTTPESSASNSTATWIAAGAKVTFRAGPWKQESGDLPRSFSSYEILHQVNGMTVSTAIESAQWADYFKHSPGASSAKFIRLFASESGKTLLIQEEIPNDCAPCTNHILVRLNSEELAHVYLELPTQDPKPGEENSMEFDQPAEVISITDHSVTYNYPGRRKETTEFSKLPSAKRPTFPG
jgi:hypothetical protein